MGTFRKFLREWKDAPTLGKFLDLNDIPGEEFNKKLANYTWQQFLSDAHDGKLPKWFNSSDTEARDKIWDYAKKKYGKSDKDFAEYVKSSVMWFPGITESKTFRKYLSEATSNEMDSLRKEVKTLAKSTIQRSTNKGFYVAVDCIKDSDGTYEVSDSAAILLNGLTSLWNQMHSNNKIDWEMPDSSKEQVYIHFIK